MKKMRAEGANDFRAPGGKEGRKEGAGGGAGFLAWLLK